jgi:hypothetical protein
MARPKKTDNASNARNKRRSRQHGLSDTSDSEDELRVQEFNPTTNIVNKKKMDLGLIHLINSYDGDTDTCRYWVSEFENIAKLSNWDEIQKLTIFKAKLVGPAKKFLMEDIILTESNSYDEIKEKFLLHFTVNQSLIEKNVNFSKINMCDQELVRNYAERLKRAGTNFIGSSSIMTADTKKMFDKLLVSRFIEGLLPELQRDIIIADPKSFEEAVERATHIQNAKSLYAQLRVNSIQCKQEQSARDLNIETKETILAINEKNQSTNMAQNQIAKQCMYCGKLGHFAIDCYQLKKMNESFSKLQMRQNQNGNRGNFRQNNYQNRRGYQTQTYERQNLN